MAKHILAVAPKSAKVVFENDEVRIVEITLKKGQKMPMHTHNKGVGYALKKSKYRSTDAGGKSAVVKMKKGDASWSEAESTHSVENLGGTSKMLSIELKK